MIVFLFSRALTENFPRRALLDMPFLTLFECTEQAFSFYFGWPTATLARGAIMRIFVM